MSDVRIGLLSNRERTTNRIDAFNAESSKYQLPALPIFLELVIRRIKDAGFHNMPSFDHPWDW